MMQMLTGLTSSVNGNLTTHYDLTRSNDPFLGLIMDLMEIPEPPKVFVFIDMSRVV